MREYSHILIYIEREFSPLAKGGEGWYSPVGVFFLEKRMQMMHSESIPSRLVFGIFLEF